MYTSCMNSGKVQKDSLEDLKEIVSRLGGWPVLEGDSWQGEQGFRWWKMSMRAAKEGLVTWQMNGAFTIGMLGGTILRLISSDLFYIMCRFSTGSFEY